MNQQILITPEQIQQLQVLMQSLAGMSASAQPNSTAPAEGSTPVDAPAQPSSAVEPDREEAPKIHFTKARGPSYDEREFIPSREAIYQGAPKPKVKAKAPDYVSGVLSSTARQFSVIALWPLIAVALVLSGLVYWYAPAKILVIAYGIAKLALFAVSGALTDFLLFPDDAPETLQGVEQGTAWKRRTWIVCAAIVAGALLP